MMTPEQAVEIITLLAQIKTMVNILVGFVSAIGVAVVAMAMRQK